VSNSQPDGELVGTQMIPTRIGIYGTKRRGDSEAWIGEFGDEPRWRMDLAASLIYQVFVVSSLGREDLE
jgi:hypothetical protein